MTGELLPLTQTRRQAMALLRPPPKISTADWIERNVILPAEGGALPGPMRLWAYQRGIVDAFDDPSVERITVLKAARVGYSEMVRATMLSLVANDPTPMMALLPTDQDARDFAVALEKLAEASPSVRGAITDDTDDRSTLVTRYFPGGSLKFLSARAPRNLRGHTARVLVMDEVDGFEVTKEGDPVTLAEMRTESYPDSKIVLGSTPTFDLAATNQNYQASDRRVFETPCPSCGEFSVVAWKDIRWEEGDPASACWICPASGCVVDESNKAAMVAAGRWRATRPDVRGHAGFALNGLLSPHPKQAWSRLITKFLRAKDKPELLQPFVNTVLGEAWKAEGDLLDEEALIARREGFSLENLPADVLILTVGVDVQNDRLEIVVLGHGRTALYVLEHEVLHGPYDGDAVWSDLDALLRRTWQHPNGGSIRIDAAGIDAGDGHHTDTVHAFTRPRFGRRVVSTKGVPGFRQLPIARSKSSGPPLWLVGVDAIKSKLFDRLPKAETLRFSEALRPVYFEQLASERRVVRYSRGQPTASFERIKGKRAETLDATVYAWAVRDLVGIDLDTREAELAETVASPVTSSRGLQTVAKSSWLSTRQRPLMT